MRGIESKIGFDKVKAQILAKLSTNMAAEILQNEEPLFTREEILEVVQRLKEYYRVKIVVTLNW